MADLTKNRRVGRVALVLGMLTLMMFAFEVRDGALLGSRAWRHTILQSDLLLC